MCIKGWWVGDHRGQVWDGDGEAFLATRKGHVLPGVHLHGACAC